MAPELVELLTRGRLEGGQQIVRRGDGEGEVDVVGLERAEEGLVADLRLERAEAEGALAVDGRAVDGAARELVGGLVDDGVPAAEEELEVAALEVAVDLVLADVGAVLLGVVDGGDVVSERLVDEGVLVLVCLLYTSPSPRDS